MATKGQKFKTFTNEERTEIGKQIHVRQIFICNFSKRI